jgi:phosphoglycolate phosphatase
MGKQFDLVVFDWDGTLFDSTGAIVRALQASCRDVGVPVPSDAQASHVIGLELSQALQQVAPSLPEARLPEMVDRYRYHYLARDSEITSFEGIGDLVEELFRAGIHLAVATGKSRNGLNRAMMGSGLEPYFVASRCADECFSKPHPQMLYELMEEVGVAPERTLMIGDTTHDLQMAINASASCVAVSYGAHPEDALKALQPLACIGDVSELAAWMRLNA